MLPVIPLTLHGLCVQGWLDIDHVVVGTKCNQLLTLSTVTGKVCAGLALQALMLPANMVMFICGITAPCSLVTAACPAPAKRSMHKVC